MSEDQFTKLFKYMDRRFSEVDSRLIKQDKKIDKIYNNLDRDLKSIEEILQENAVRDRQQERMERWIFQLADKTKSTLKYEG